ncbi:MAG TPA: LysR family transcriptional regulator, partial [Ramlibacter sp.]|nr:LysR family transcriptional regulator [Ramlibacter sp.]
MDSLDLIKTFREVALRGSFSAAARGLDVSKANSRASPMWCRSRAAWT